MAKRLVYFVSYVTGGSNQLVVHQIEVYRQQPIGTFEAAVEVNRYIQQHNDPGAMITGFALLRTEDVPEQRPATVGSGD